MIFWSAFQISQTKIGKLKPQKEKLNLSNFEYLAIKTLLNNKETIKEKRQTKVQQQ